MLSVNFCKFTQVLGFLVVLLIPVAVSAQVSGGTISGKVTDSTGALIPGAQVAIRNTATGITTNLVANEEGIYRASNLLAGDYEITASAPTTSETVPENRLEVPMNPATNLEAGCS